MWINYIIFYPGPSIYWVFCVAKKKNFFFSLLLYIFNFYQKSKYSINNIASLHWTFLYFKICHVPNATQKSLNISVVLKEPTHSVHCAALPWQSDGSVAGGQKVYVDGLFPSCSKRTVLRAKDGRNKVTTAGS